MLAVIFFGVIADVPVAVFDTEVVAYRIGEPMGILFPAVVP